MRGDERQPGVKLLQTVIVGEKRQERFQDLPNLHFAEVKTEVPPMRFACAKLRILPRHQKCMDAKLKIRLQENYRMASWPNTAPISATRWAGLLFLRGQVDRLYTCPFCES